MPAFFLKDGSNLSSMNSAPFLIFLLTAAYCAQAVGGSSSACADCPTTCWKNATCLPIQCLKDAAMESFGLVTTASTAAADNIPGEPIWGLQDLHNNPAVTEEGIGAILLQHHEPLQLFRKRVDQCLQQVQVKDTVGGTTSKAPIKMLRKIAKGKSDEATTELAGGIKAIPYFGVLAKLGFFVTRTVQVVVAMDPSTDDSSSTSLGVFAMVCKGLSSMSLVGSVQPVTGVLLLADSLDDMVGTWTKLDSDVLVEPVEVAASVAVGSMVPNNVQFLDVSLYPVFPPDFGVTGPAVSGNTCNRWRIFNNS